MAAVGDANVTEMLTPFGQSNHRSADIAASGGFLRIQTRISDAQCTNH